jgi:HAD superfamily hydrolase (TIGR01509 family)
MTRAYIFDLDGTLLDSEILWCKAMHQLLSNRGFPVTEDYASELVFGRAWSDVLIRLRQDFPSLTGNDRAIEQESQILYNILRATVDIRIHSSIELLKRLAQHHPVAIVSGSTRRQIAEAIELMSVQDCLTFYLGNEDYPRGKPDPTCFLLAARHFGVEPGQCLVFEDSSAGVRAAKAAHMRCVALRRRLHPPQDVSMADLIVADLSEFTPDTRWSS